MFLECFPDRLTPTWFDSFFNRIYVLDHTSRLFYELDDIGYNTPHTGPPSYQTH